MEFQVSISYEDGGYELEIYPFNGNSISGSDFESQNELEDILAVAVRYLSNINLEENYVHFSSNCNSEKRRVLSIEDIKHFAQQDFSQYL